jgi:hypothetical protein
MKRGAILAGLAAMVLSIGCGTDVELGNRPQFSNGKSALTVLAFDGTTGTSLETATMAMHIGPITVTAERVGNAYTFLNVPSTVMYPIFVTAAGYLDFVGQAAALASGSLAEPGYTTLTLPMFPTNSVPGDYTFKVYDDKGAAVTGGYILAALDTSGINTAFDQTLTTNLPGAWGFKPSVIRIDLTAGVAVIPAAQMVYGAKYKVTVVNAKNAAGSYLKPPATSTNINPTQDYLQKQVFMGVPAETPVIISATNEQPNDQKAMLSLTVNFAMDVEICPDSTVTDFWDVFTFASPVGTTTSTQKPLPATPPAPNATFGGGGSSLSITPTLNGPNTTWKTTATIKNVKVKIKGTPTDSTNCVTLIGQPIRDNAGLYGNLSGVIYLSNP